MTDPTVPSAVMLMADKQQITEVLYRYARGCDRCDEAALRSCFHPDSTHRHGAFAGPSHDFCELALQIVRPLAACKHMISNVMIEIRGNRAVSESHFLSYHRVVDAESGEVHDRFHGGRYLDRLEKRHGEWKILHRTGLYDFERIALPTETPSRPAPELCSRQQPADPLYELLDSL
jgi:hypothetical protein